MAKDPKWIPSGPPPPEHLRNIEMTGEGVLDPWAQAVYAIDVRGNKKPLIDMLKSNREIPNEARIYLADLIDRYEFKRPNHRPRTPAYDRSRAELYLELGILKIKDRRSEGVSVDKAVARVSKELGIPENILTTAYFGKRGSSRRTKRRSTRP
jgi:hypothetical protein